MSAVNWLIIINATIRLLDAFQETGLPVTPEMIRDKEVLADLLAQKSQELADEGGTT